MSIFESRLFRLFRPAGNVAEMTQQVNDLRDTLMSALQEVVVLKSLLQVKGIWDAALYQRLRVKQMIDDHDTRGPGPWAFHSYYPYMLEEGDFLRQMFNASDAEIDAFEKQVASVEQNT